MTDLYSGVHKRFRKRKVTRSALIIREPQLAYVKGYMPCCDDHAYAVVVPMSTHLVNGLVSGHAVGGAPDKSTLETGVVPRWAFTIPLEEFLELDFIDATEA